MSTRTPVKLDVIPGAVRVNCGFVEQTGDTVVALTVDLHSKRAEILGYGMIDGIPAIDLYAGEHTLHTDTRTQEIGRITILKFPEYEGWTLHCADIARYTLRLCLTKD